MVSPSEKKVLMRQEAESKLLAQANARDPEIRLVKIRSGKGKVYNTQTWRTKLKYRQTVSTYNVTLIISLAAVYGENLLRRRLCCTRH